MGFSEIKAQGRKKSEKQIFKGAFIILVFLSFFLSLSFMTVSIRLLISAPRIENCLYFLGDKSPEFVNLIFSVLVLAVWLMFFAPAFIGLYSWFIKNAMNDEKNIDEIFSFYSFKKSFKCFNGVLFLVLLKVGLWMFFCLPSIAVIFFVFRSLFYEEIFKSVAIIFFTGAGILFLIGSFCAGCAVQRYAVVPYIIALNPDVNLYCAIKASVRIMQKENLKFLLFKLSFLVWFFSCIFVLPVFWVWIYYKESCAVWILNAVNKQKTW